MYGQEVTITATKKMCSRFFATIAKFFRRTTTSFQLGKELGKQKMVQRNQSPSSRTCFLCMEQITAEENICILQCGHFFHIVCEENWKNIWQNTETKHGEHIDTTFVECTVCRHQVKLQPFIPCASCTSQVLLANLENLKSAMDKRCTMCPLQYTC